MEQAAGSSSSTRKQKWTSFTITVWHALFMNWLNQGDRIVVLQINQEWIPYMVKFMIAHASFFAAGGPKNPKRCTKVLRFAGPLKEPIYTTETLTHRYNQPLELQLVDIITGKICTDLPVYVELVVLDGDFGSDEQHDYTRDQFETSILTPKKDKGPLLVSCKEQKLVKALENGRVIFKDLKITDNSTLAKNGKFRLGARVKLPRGYRGPRIEIKEGWTENFRVFDIRNKSGEKHETPSLGDEVWRLKNIAKDKTYHKRLLSFKNSAGDPVIKTVGNFLTALVTIGPERLKSTLQISDKNWQELVEHACRARFPVETNRITGEMGMFPYNGGYNTQSTSLTQFPSQTGTWQHVVPHQTNFGVYPISDSLAPEFNQGCATNCLVQGETSMFRSGEYAAEANTFLQSNVSPYNPLLENMGMPQQAYPQVNIEVYQTGPSFNEDGRKRSGLLEQGESSKEKQRTSFTITVWRALFVNSVSQESSTAGTTVLQGVNTKCIQCMFEFMSGHAGFFLVERRKRSRKIIQQDEEAEPPNQPTKRLKFAGPLKIPTHRSEAFLYTNETLTHKDNQPLEVQLIDINTGAICTDLPVYVELVVLDGDFGSDAQRVYTRDQFERSILGPRRQKGPLLISYEEKNLVKVLEQGKVTFKGIKITDISKLAKNDKFKIGARVKMPQGHGIEEGCTEEFRVKDIRGKSGEKHDTPSIGDKVWRLKNIAKGGVYYKKMLKAFFLPDETSRDLTVKDFLELLDKDSEKLKSALHMTEKQWQESVAQANKARIPEEASMPNSGGNENIAPTLALQVLEPTFHPPHPIQATLQNMDVQQHVGPLTDPEFCRLDNFLVNPTINQGHATNCYFQGGTSTVFNSSGGFDLSAYNPYENTVNGQQMNARTNLETNQISGSLPSISTVPNFNEERVEPSHVQPNNQHHFGGETQTVEDNDEIDYTVFLSFPDGTSPAYKRYRA